MGNVWTQVIFGASEPDAFEFARHIGPGSLDPNAIREKTQMDIQHPIFQPSPEQWNAFAAALANQKPREAIVRTYEGQTEKMWAASIDTSISGELLQEICQVSLWRHGDWLECSKSAQVHDAASKAHVALYE